MSSATNAQEPRNTDNEDELKRTSLTISPELFRLAEKRRREKFDRNFSLYVHRLITEDLERGKREAELDEVIERKLGGAAA